MEDDKKSPIIERLRQFISSTGLTSSQFADKAGIPRPSLSQMFHGRNKSLNNNVLAKLNSAFPNLNIVWLLFGTGNMLNVSNIEISEPQTPLFPEFASSVNVDNEWFEDLENETEQPIIDNQNRITTPPAPSANSQQAQQQAPSQQNPIDGKVQQTLPGNLSQILPKRDGAKQIKSIIVLYTDSSFETFMPTND